jgi:hypothetical protein
MDFVKKPEENYQKYIWRMDELVQSGKYQNWKEITPFVNKELFGEDESQYRDESAYRKAVKYARDFYEAGVFGVNDDEYLNQIRKEKEEIRKERIKLQTVNIERNRVDRGESRQEFYYEYVSSVIEALPVPEFRQLFENRDEDVINYLVCLSDLHYGASFKSENNEYSPAIFKERLEYLSERIYDFITRKQLSKIHIACLGDTLQGLLRASDLKINDSSVVKATVEISRLIAQFLNSLSEFVKIEYYHVPSANHTQSRPLGTKASEIADEDLEYVISHYIEDLCRYNDRINVKLADEGKQYIEIDIEGFEVLAMHGHQIKNMDTSLKDLSMLRRSFCDYLILGHFHNGKEIPSAEGCCHDTEILVCPSFVGSDPYSDSIMKGSKAAVKIYGFDELYGHTETYKIILN